jgi:hypothetical protein
LTQSNLDPEYNCTVFKNSSNMHTIKSANEQCIIDQVTQIYKVMCEYRSSQSKESGDIQKILWLNMKLKPL